MIVSNADIGWRMAPSNSEERMDALDDQQTASVARMRERFAIAILLLLLAGLPLAVWSDMKNLTTASLQRQAGDVTEMITSIRGFYSNNVVDRIRAHQGSGISALHNYEAVPGAIPLPATLSLELGKIIGAGKTNISYRFFSDFPFRNRAPHPFDAFEKQSLEELRRNPDVQPVIESSSSGMSSRLRMVSPVLMTASCVSCHNSHPDSTKRDWKVGDVRGLQEVTVTQPIALNLWSFKYTLAYFLCAAGAGFAFIYMQRRQNAVIRGMNRELRGTNDFLASISMKISHYLSPQIYKSIFSGEMDVALQTQRKKLTIFFSDIKDFTALTEKLQPEELTALINEYFTEMSAIALKHGGTIDKFIGDAILVFFGDPTSQGAAADAKACMRMAIDMQHKLAELNVRWRKLGAEEPFRVRMGINTGFCNVGNFGSADRMDYTILGAEANLAARLQSSAEPGGIVVSYETYALVRDMVAAHALPPTSMKGISREVVPYAIDGLLDADGNTVQVFSEHQEGLDLYLDLGRIDASASKSLRSVFQKAIAALDRHEGE
jgi:class 3 adenylate cyclase